MLKTSSFLSNQRGESLVTIAVAMMILMIAGLTAGPTIMRAVKSQKNNLMAPSFCRDISQNILAQIRSNGMQTKVYRSPAQQNSVRYTDTSWRGSDNPYDSINPGGVESEHGIGPALETVRWPNELAMQWNSANDYFVPNSPPLMYSSMNVLQAVNNAFANQACTQPQGIPINASTGLEPLLPQSTIDMYAEAGYFVAASIKTQPFRVSDETLLPCDGNLRLRPFGEEEPPRSDSQGLTANLQADGSINNGHPNLGNTYQANLGLKTEDFVTVDHIDPAARDGQDRRLCSSSEKFQYDRVVSNIPVPTIDTSGDLQIQLASPTGAPRRRLTGIFMACAYEYQFFTVGPAAFSAGPVVGDLNQWIPCQQVRVCGGGAPQINETEFDIEYDFNRAPPASCSFSLRVTAFDAVGNSLAQPPFVRCYNGTCGTGTNTPVPGGPTGSNANDSANPGYQVSGVTFDNAQAAQQAAALTGAPVQAVDLNATATAAINSSQMLSHTNAVGSVTTSTASINATVNGLAADGTSGSVDAAQGAVDSAAANVSAAQDAVNAANGMGSSMGAVKDAAVAEAEAALAEAEAALQAAQEALEAAEDAKEAADAADDDDGTS